MKNRIVLIAAFAAIILIGCGETPEETTSDVTKANKEASESNAKARTDAAQVESKANESVADATQTYARTDAKAQVKLGAAEADAMTKKARAEFDLAMTAAKGTFKVASQKCDALGGVDRTACTSTADAALATASGDATVRRDAALVAAEYHR